MIGQLFQVLRLGAMFPIYCTIYMIAPNSKMGSFMKKPFVKFICHSSSYVLFLGEFFPEKYLFFYEIFLVLLGAASQRVEIIFMEIIDNHWLQEIVSEWKRKERGAGPGFAECGVVIYMISTYYFQI